MVEWKNITLGAVLKYEQPYKYTVESTQYNNSGVPVLTAGKSFILGYTSETNNLYSNLPVIIFDDFTSDCKFVDFPFKVKSSAMKFLKERNEEEISLKYFYEILQTLKLDSVGGDHKRRWISEYSKIKIKAPDFIEQTHIAEILSTADETIAYTEALIAKYQCIKTGLMQDLLTKGIDENGNIRSKETHKFVVKNGVEVPEEWEVDILKNKCNLHNNLRKPIAAIERFQNKGSFPYYGATGIIDYINEYRVEGLLVLIGEDGDHYLKFKSQEMTHLVEGKFNVSNHAHILSGKENCSTKWIHYFFCHRDITYFLTRQGAGRFKLNKASLQNLPICVPSPNEQLSIIEKIECFNENYNLEKIKLKKLNSLKTGLMQDLLSGKVRVNIKN